MDRRPALAAARGPRLRATAPPAPPAALVLDQAVFTSIRSPTARGYRLVAASPGLSEDERRELVQRAPSHGNLTSDANGDGALAGFVLRSGRHALLLARHAGPEPSGRGGLRVHTHALVFSGPVYRRFRFDPFCVAAFLRGHPAVAGCDPASSALAGIAAPTETELPPQPADADALSGVSAPEVEQIAESVLCGQRLIVTDAPAPRATLRVVFAVTPLGLRRSLSFALGMKPSIQRAFALLFHASREGEWPSLARDAGYGHLAWGQPRATRGTPFGPWLDFVRRCLEQGQLCGVRTLADRLDDPCSPESLARLAELATDQPTVGSLDVAALERLQTKWPVTAARSAAERELLERLHATIADRLAKLQTSTPGAAFGEVER